MNNNNFFLISDRLLEDCLLLGVNSTVQLLHVRYTHWHVTRIGRDDNSASRPSGVGKSSTSLSGWG